jgi:hypothetical protein
VTARVTLVIAVALAYLALLAGCDERARASDDAGGSRPAAMRTVAEHTTEEMDVGVQASGRDAAAQAGHAEARGGEGAMARAGDAVARAGVGAGVAGARAKAGEEADSTQAHGEDVPRKVDLEVRVDRDMRFSGTCSVGGDERRIAGRVPKSYSFDPGDGKLECEIHKDGPGVLAVVLASGGEVRSVQRQAGAGSGTINVSYSGSGGSSVSSSTRQVGAVVSSITSSTKRSVKNR